MNLSFLPSQARLRVHYIYNIYMNVHFLAYIHVVYLLNEPILPSFAGKVKSPFVLNLKYAFQNGETLYLVLDLMTGGDLAFHLRKLKRFDENLVRFYSASVLEGVYYGFLGLLYIIYII